MATASHARMRAWRSGSPIRRRRTAFRGSGAATPTAQGMFRFTTVKPGPVPGRGNAQQAPHIAICVLSRGLMRGLVTRAYFQGETLNETDPLLMSIEEPARRATLIARAGRGGDLADGRAAAGRGRDGVPGYVSGTVPTNPADSPILGTLYGSDAMRAVFDEPRISSACSTSRRHLRGCRRVSASSRPMRPTAITAAARVENLERRGTRRQRAQCRLSGGRTG